MSAPVPLEIFVQCLKNVPDPRSRQGSSQPFRTVLALLFLGLLANRSTLAEIERWAKIHLTQLRHFLRFRSRKGTYRVPSDTTFSRVLQQLSLADLQNAFAAFLNAILPDKPLAAAVDGKAAKQMKDDNGDPIFMLNVFAQTVKLHLASWSVHGDKTNEPGCLKQHLEELFTMYPWDLPSRRSASPSKSPLRVAALAFSKGKRPTGANDCNGAEAPNAWTAGPDLGI